MSKLNDFANSIESFARNEDFNFAYWLSYICLLTCIAGLIPLVIIPPVGFIFLGIVLAPLVVYGALWAVVGVAKLLNYIDFKIHGLSEFKDSDDADANINNDVTSAVAAYPHYQDEGIIAYNAQGPVNASAAQYANPLAASSHYVEPKPVEYDQLGFATDNI